MLDLVTREPFPLGIHVGYRRVIMMMLMLLRRSDTTHTQNSGQRDQFMHGIAPVMTCVPERL